MFDQDILDAAEALVARAIGLGLWITTAESCTGGLIAGALTSVSGASNCVGAGFVTYSNGAKVSALGVLPETLDNFGAVSEQVASEMAIGACKAAHADLSLAVTGVAGPLGGTIEKPVGLVYIAAALGKEMGSEGGDAGTCADVEAGQVVSPAQNEATCLSGLPQAVFVERHEFGDIGRALVRRETVLSALSLGLKCLNERCQN